MTDAARLAAKFSALLRGAIGPSIIDVIERNKAETNPNVCHSHDFIDANVVMAEAFKKVFGRDPDATSDADAGLWGAAWSLSKAQKFQTQCPGGLRCAGRDCATHGDGN